MGIFRRATAGLFWVIALATLFYGVVARAQAPKARPMSPVEFVEMPRLSDPVMSPDGRKIIYLRSQTNWEENDGFRRYVLQDVQTGDEIAVFPSAKKTENFSAPIWSPDSRGFISLLRRNPTKGDDSKEKPNRQAYYFTLETNTLERLTEHNSDVGEIQWAPDGLGFYFSAKQSYDPVYKQALDDKFAIKPYISDLAYEVWFFDLATKTSRKTVSGDFFLRGYRLSRDGQKILHMRAAGPTSDERHDGELWSFDIRSGEAVKLTDNHYAESRSKFAPDNSAFAYIATVNKRGEPYYEDNLFIHNTGSNRANLVLPKMAMEIQDFYWGDDAETIFILGNTGLRSQIYRYDVSSMSLTEITHGDQTVLDWTVNTTTRTHAYIARSETSPGDLFVLNNSGVPKKISTIYSNFAETYRLPRQEAFRWEGRKGVTLEGLLAYPIDHKRGEKFPLVTITHGGPRSSSQFGSWNMSRAVPILTGQGYGVFLPNHRGGVGYGDDFMRDMVGGYFTHAHSDVMDGIDALIDAGLADPEQLIKQGWSAGGHMTNKLITVTDRFKAASSGAGVADWVSMYGESDIRHNRTPWFGRAPWEKYASLKTYQKGSPLKDTWRVTTPTLFWNGGNDVRVPPTQAILMYRGVKAAGAETELYIGPEQPHGFSKPGYRLFKINTELAWYAKHLGQEAFIPVLPDMSLSESD